MLSTYPCHTNEAFGLSGFTHTMFLYYNELHFFIISISRPELSVDTLSDNLAPAMTGAH